jgi:ADP-L-glycero-D-manno-heptose 6-epimerase
MKILITGHDGFIGKNLISTLANHNLSGYEWIKDSLPEVKGFDWVIHLGAISSTTEKDVDKVILQNYEFSKWLYNECRLNGVNLQYSSSASVYGNNVNFKEDAPKQPLNPYAWSKYLFDRWVSQQKHNILVQGFRYFNVYGPNEEHKKDQASPYTKFIKQAKEKKQITLFKGSEYFKRDFVCVEDVCDVHLKMLDVNCSGIWNVGSGTAVSFEDVGQAIAKKYDAKINYVPMPQELKTQYQTYTCANLTALNNVISKKFISIKDYINGTSYSD